MGKLLFLHQKKQPYEIMREIAESPFGFELRAIEDITMSPHRQRDESPVGLNLFFPTSLSPKDLESWCDPAPDTQNTWHVSIIRQDNERVGGRVNRFMRVYKGLLMYVHLLNGLDDCPPDNQVVQHFPKGLSCIISRDKVRSFNALSRAALSSAQ